MTHPHHPRMCTSTTSSSSNPDETAAGAANVQVVVRLRPMNATEKADGTLPVVSANSRNKSISINNNKKGALPQVFQFDQVYSSFARQEHIFRETVQPLIGDVLNGYEACVFAYGQVRTSNKQRKHDSGNIHRKLTFLFFISFHRQVPARHIPWKGRSTLQTNTALSLGLPKPCLIN